MIAQTAVVDRLPNQQQLKNKLIYDLLHGSIGDEEALAREAKILGMDLTPPRAVILIDATDYTLGADGGGPHAAAQARRRAQVLIGSIVGFFKLPNDTICAYIGEGEVAVLKASNTKEPGELGRRRGRAGADQPVVGQSERAEAGGRRAAGAPAGRHRRGDQHRDRPLPPGDQRAGALLPGCPRGALARPPLPRAEPGPLPRRAGDRRLRRGRGRAHQGRPGDLPPQPARPRAGAAR
jgi:hypothetical protein